MAKRFHQGSGLKTIVTWRGTVAMGISVGFTTDLCLVVMAMMMVGVVMVMVMMTVTMAMMPVVLVMIVWW